MKRAKLSLQQAQHIREDYTNGIPPAFLARLFGVSEASILAIVRGQTYRYNPSEL